MMDRVKRLYVIGSLTDRLSAHSVSDLLSGCRLWTATKNKKGYGQLTIAGKRAWAHRVAYTLAHGEIPYGLQVLHKCDRPSCINAEHLFLGSNADNHADKIAKGRHAFGSRAGGAILKEHEVLEILNSSQTQRCLASLYGVSRGTINDIKCRRTWRHVQ